ncbi:MAG: FIST signal transduction protein [Bacillota bacterium]
MFEQVMYVAKVPVDLEQLFERFRGTQQALMVLVGEKAPVDLDELCAAATKSEAEVFGGIFPGVIFGGKCSSSGIVVASLRAPVRVITVPNLEKPPQLELQGTAVILLDGMATSISSFLHTLFASTTAPTSFIGGGAGRLGHRKTPCLFSSQGVFCGGAVIAVSSAPVGVGIGHGWEAFLGPYVATSTEGPWLRELNWKPAFEVYTGAIGQCCPQPLDALNFWSVSRRFPFGMARLDGSIVIRDPIRVEQDGSILVVGEVPENSVLLLMKGEPEKLVLAATEATKAACHNYVRRSQAKPRFALVMDCVSRVVCTEEHMLDELGAVEHTLPAGVQSFGFLTVGEVACADGYYLEFHNKTAVVGVC